MPDEAERAHTLTLLVAERFAVSPETAATIALHASIIGVADALANVTGAITADVVGRSPLSIVATLLGARR